MYEKLLAGDVLQVQFKGQPDWAHKGPFTIQRLLLIGEYYVRETEIWARWASVGGVVINRRHRQRLSEGDLREFCAGLEEV